MCRGEGVAAVEGLGRDCRSGIVGDDDLIAVAAFVQHQLSGCAGVTITGNTFNVWKDDTHAGDPTPDYGIVIENCSHCVIAGNAMMAGAARQLVLNKGGNGEQIIISDNAGAAIPPKALDSRDPFTPAHYMLEGGAPWYSEMLKGEENNK